MKSRLHSKCAPDRTEDDKLAYYLVPLACLQSLWRSQGLGPNGRQTKGTEPEVSAPVS